MNTPKTTSTLRNAIYTLLTAILFILSSTMALFMTYLFRQQATDKYLRTGDISFTYASNNISEIGIVLCMVSIAMIALVQVYRINK